MTYVEALNQATRQLLEPDCPRFMTVSPHLDAEVLLCHVMNFSKEDLISHRKENIQPRDSAKLAELIKERQTGVPVAYLTGTKEFFRHKFKVNKHVLIPRPDTEALVERMVFELKGKHNLKILDIGTGSGCIIISLAKELSNANRYFGSDESARALAVAEDNALAHKVKITFIRSDLAKNTGTDFDVVVANLPYLPRTTDESTKFEPKHALVADRGGLALYEKLLKQIAESPHRPLIYLEFGHDQAEGIKNLADKLLPGSKTEIFRDLSGVPRIARIWQHPRASI